MSEPSKYRVFVRWDHPPPQTLRHKVREANVDLRSRPDASGNSYGVTLYSDGTTSVSKLDGRELPSGERRDAIIAAVRDQDVEPYQVAGFRDSID